MNLSRIDLPDGPILQAVVRDISEQKAAFEQVRQARDRARKYFEVAGTLMVVLDPNGRVTAINQQGRELVGLPSAAIVGEDWFGRFLPDENREEVRAVFRRLVAGEEEIAASYENVVLTGAGERRTLAFRNTILRDEQGAIEGILASGTDVTQQRALEETLRYQARHDPLTGLLNRGALDEALDREVERIQRYGGTLGLIMLDLDHFKVVNDRFGHPTGDRVLQGVVQCLQDELRGADVLGRWGGEEFIAFLPHTDAEEAAGLAERIRQSVAGIPFEEVGRVTVSLGVTELEAGQTRSAMLKRLDNALYQAKEEGRNRVVTLKP